VGVPTLVFLREVEQATQRLAPLFGLSSCNPPEIRTYLLDYEHPTHPRHWPGFSPIYKFVYFPPWERTAWAEHGGYSRDCFQHEVAHYIHDLVNPDLQAAAFEWESNKKVPPGMRGLREVVAEYPNFILGDTGPGGWVAPYMPSAFAMFGSDALPKLARMNLEEAVTMYPYFLNI